LLSGAQQVFWLDAALDTRCPRCRAPAGAAPRHRAAAADRAAGARRRLRGSARVLDPRLAAVTAAAMARVLQERAW